MNNKELILIILAILIGCSIIAGAIYYSSDNVASNESNNTTNSTNATNITQDEQNKSDTSKEDNYNYENSQSSYSSGKSQSSHESNDLNYDSELNLYYDNNGIVVDPDGEHPQGVGLSYEYMASHNCGEE